MIKLLLFTYFLRCFAGNNPFTGYDFGQHYTRIRIFEYDSYSDVKFLKFNIQGPTITANWSINLSNENKCQDSLSNIHFYLQHGTYPLVAPKNESFPETYISYRHNLFTLIFNQTQTNPLIQLRNPLVGTWFAMIFIDHRKHDAQTKISSTACNTYLSTWLDYQILPNISALVNNEPLQFVLKYSKTAVYASYYTSPGNNRITVRLESSSNCSINMFGRVNGLPNLFSYDYKTVCQNKTCAIEINQLSALTWIYFQITVQDISCLSNPIYGSVLLHSTDCSPLSQKYCIQIYSTRRIMFNYYYDFLYVPIYTPTRSNSGSTSSIILNGNGVSIYSYEFIVDDRNIGGTLHFDFESRFMPISSSNMNVNASILGCLSKYRPIVYDQCENDYKIIIEKTSIVMRSIPYPEAALWYLTLQFSCNGSKNDCTNASISLIFQLSSSQCTKQQCGTYGICRIMTSQQNVFSTCTCLAGYRGYGCTDGSNAYESKNLSNVLFLTLSNIMFLPAIILAIHKHLYIEALIYFFNMFFSTFYHACDQDINKFCIFKYDGLQLSDFIGSYASFVVTLLTMAKVSRSTKVFLFMLGVLTCIVINSRDRFDHVQFIFLISVTFIFTITTWIIVSMKTRRLQPSSKRLLFFLPGFVLALAGLILFAFCETDKNYWYIHSLWHILIASSILFFLPRKAMLKKDVKEEYRMNMLKGPNESELLAQEITTSQSITKSDNNSSSASISNQISTNPVDNASLSSSNTDTSKKSSDNLLNEHS